MLMTVIASGSSGNGYVLQGRRSALIIECGVTPEKVVQTAATLCWSQVVGCLVTHEHGDHAGYASRYMDLGLQVYASAGTLRALGLTSKLAHPLQPLQGRRIGDFQVFPFDVRHDAAEPLGFVIGHPELGRLLFVTDASAIPYTFKKMGIDHIMIEANYADNILEGEVKDGALTIERAQRIRHTHMGLREAQKVVQDNETGRLKTVTLLHLSSQNASPTAFQRRMQAAVLFADVKVAQPGLIVKMKGHIEL